MINIASMTFVGAIAAGLMLGVWYSRSKPLHIESRQAIPLQVAQEHDRKVRAEKAQSFEESGERYHFVASWDRDSKLPDFYSASHKVLKEIRQKAAEFVQAGFGPAEIWDAKFDKPIERFEWDESQGRVLEYYVSDDGLELKR